MNTKNIGKNLYLNEKRKGKDEVEKKREDVPAESAKARNKYLALSSASH